MLKTIGAFLLFCALNMVATLSFGSPAYSHFERSGLQASAYAGAAQTAIYPGLLQGLSETDLLHPNYGDHEEVDFTWGFGAAYRFLLPTSKQTILHDISAGLDFWYYNTSQAGQTWLFEQPIYSNYNYQLPITSLRLLADSEWTFRSLLLPYLFPFIEGGIGFARNTASYSDTPLLANTSSLSIASNTQYQFSYTVGGGVKILLPADLAISLRYLYADLGNATTSTTADVVLAAPITIRLTTQTWLAGVSYLF